MAINIAVCFLAVFDGCEKHDPDKYIFSPGSSVAVDKLFTLSVLGDSTLPADGFSTVILDAQVNNVSEGPRSVLFTTSGGYLKVGSTVYGDSAFVETDLEGHAKVELMSSRMTGSARVIARVIDATPSLMQEQTIIFTPVQLDNIITFVDTPDSAYANGKAITTIAVRISPLLQGDDRKVLFTTTEGNFIPMDEAPSSIIMAAGDDNLATVSLRSPETVSEARVTATVKNFTRETVIHFVTVPTESVIAFTEYVTSAPADGATLSKLVVKVSPSLLGVANATVEFETNHGSFASSTVNSRLIQVNVDSNNEAAIYLRSSTEIEKALVTATVKNYKQSRIVEFVWAAPDTILMLVPEFQLSTNSHTQIMAELVRNEGRGIVTMGTELAFQAADSLGNKVDRAKFFNLTRSDQNGVASVYFTPDGTSYRGLVTITAQPAREDSSAVGEATLRIVD